MFLKLLKYTERYVLINYIIFVYCVSCLVTLVHVSYFQIHSIVISDRLNDIYFGGMKDLKVETT